MSTLKGHAKILPYGDIAAGVYTNIGTMRLERLMNDGTIVPVPTPPDSDYHSTVGFMRQQSALCGSDTPLVIVTPDDHNFEVVNVYPDTVHSGKWEHCFKIEIRRKAPQ